MLDEIVTYDLTTRDFGVVEIARVSTIRRDGVPIGRPIVHRSVVTPDSDLTALPTDVRATVQAWLTPERVQRFRDRLAAVIATQSVNPSLDVVRGKP